MHVNGHLSKRLRLKVSLLLSAQLHLCVSGMCLCYWRHCGRLI